jgi:hypothetical protein
VSEPRGLPFAPGNTQGRGRPKGSRNKTRSAGQDLLDHYEQNVVQTCIGYAAKGSPTALRLCMERVSPVSRNASIRTNLPRIKTAQDLEKAGAKVIRDVGCGKIAPAEGETIMRMFEAQSRIIANSQHESRLKKVEEGVAAIPRFPRAV